MREICRGYYWRLSQRRVSFVRALDDHSNLCMFKGNSTLVVVLLTITLTYATRLLMKCALHLALPSMNAMKLFFCGARSYSISFNNYIS